MSEILAIAGIALAAFIGFWALVYLWPLILCCALGQPAIGVVAEVIYLFLVLR